MIDYSKYIEVCRQAVQDDEIFKNFKRHPDYVPILEHVNYQQGLEYIARIDPAFLKYIERFATNDNIGNPDTSYYEEIGFKISPTTLRYIKVLSDLVKLFGNLSGMNIIEVGGGYGGQCKIINDIYNPKTYTIVDLPEVVALAGKYLENYNVILRDIDNLPAYKYDLFISNYAFTEIDRKYQVLYADKIIRNSDNGYITCNFIAPGNYTRDEILALKSSYTIYPEKPLTGDGNFIYTWRS